MIADTSQKLVVLLGAGASAKAGVPTTLKFVDEFRATLSGLPNLRVTYDDLVRRLKQGVLGTRPLKLVDVEAVLDALETFRNPTVVDRAIASKRALASRDELSRLEEIKTRLQEFIRTRCLVESESTEYLLPLVQLSNLYRPLPVFSVNYDVVVEQFLESHGLSYVDGFELRFNSGLFDQQETDVLLYKLHGSVTWFRSQTGGYLKLPIRSSLREIDLLSGERAVPVMLYPAQKADYAGPFLELFRRFQEALRRSDWLLVLGYSFRDPILLDLILDAAASNPKLKLILVGGRRTERVFSENLAPRVPVRKDSLGQRGALTQERIVRLPYRVECSLGDFLSTIFPSLQKAMMAHATSIWAQLHGEPARWTAAAEDYLRAGALAQGLSILSAHVRLDPLQQDQPLRFEGLLSMAHYANGNSSEGDRHWKSMKGTLHLWLVQRVNPMIVLRPQQTVQFAGNWHESAPGASGGYQYSMIANFLAEIIQVGTVTLRCLGGASPSSIVKRRIQGLRKLQHYLNSVPQQGFELRSYMTRRAGHLPRWLAALARSLSNPNLDLSRERVRIEKLELGLATTEARFVEEEFVNRL